MEFDKEARKVLFGWTFAAALAGGMVGGTFVVVALIILTALMGQGT